MVAFVPTPEVRRALEFGTYKPTFSADQAEPLASIFQTSSRLTLSGFYLMLAPVAGIGITIFIGGQ